MTPIRRLICIALVLSHSAAVTAQSVRGLNVGALAEMKAEPRIALVMGNAAYEEAPVPSATNDAYDMTRSLKRLGFDVILRLDSDKAAMSEALGEFGRRLQDKGGIGLLYYSGHALQVGQENYLLPIGNDIAEEEEVAFQALALSDILRLMEAAPSRANIILLEACRLHPLSQRLAWAIPGLARTAAAKKTFISYAAGSGEVVAPRDARNGLYTEKLLNNMHVPHRSIAEVSRMVRTQVKEAAPGQVPWFSSFLTSEFFFILDDPPPSTADEMKQLAAQDGSGPRSDRWLWVLLGLGLAGVVGAALISGGDEAPPTGGVQITVVIP